VQRVGPEGDHAERIAPALIGAGIVALQHEVVGAADQDCVHIAQQPRTDARVESFRQIDGRRGGNG
jgi:hypothetical protein